MKLKFLPLILFTVAASFLLEGCTSEYDAAVSCSAVDQSYICFDGDGRKASYNRWNFDTTDVVKTLNIQGSDPAVPGTDGPWSTISISMVNSGNVIGIETGVYDYWPVLADNGEREFTFWFKRYSGDAKNPDVVDFIKDPDQPASLTIESVSGSGEVTGVLTASVQSFNDPSLKANIKYRFYNIQPG